MECDLCRPCHDWPIWYAEPVKRDYNLWRLILHGRRDRNHVPELDNYDQQLILHNSALLVDGGFVDGKVIENGSGIASSVIMLELTNKGHDMLDKLEADASGTSTNFFPDGPWSENWSIVEPLGKGGQGTTFIATRKTDAQKGVIKILKHQTSDEARRRMYREVANLKALHGAGCKVPQILDGNTEKFESKDVNLFFVMEMIPGQRLCDVVTSKGGLGLSKAMDFAFDLLATVKKALVEDVIHRDLKPENIIVREFEKNDLVIVDYGLSFNATDDGNVTRVSETLDNDFLVCRRGECWVVTGATPVQN